MPVMYRVVDLRAAEPSETLQSASNPEQAAYLATGERMARSGRTTPPRAKVYFKLSDKISMVRLYALQQDQEPTSP